MADIYCPRCAEPWDAAELHDVEGKTYHEAKEAFRAEGCGVFDVSCERTGSLMAAAAEIVMDLGDHPDDWAADMELAEALL